MFLFSSKQVRIERRLSIYDGLRGMTLKTHKNSQSIFFRSFFRFFYERKRQNVYVNQQTVYIKLEFTILIRWFAVLLIRCLCRYVVLLLMWLLCAFSCSPFTPNSITTIIVSIFFVDYVLIISFCPSLNLEVEMFSANWKF